MAATSTIEYTNVASHGREFSLSLSLSFLLRSLDPFSIRLQEYRVQSAFKAFPNAECSIQSGRTSDYP